MKNKATSLRVRAKRYGINQKMVAKWKRRTSVADVPTGPKDPKSTVLTIEEEAIVVAFRRHKLLPLDDCLYALQATELLPVVGPLCWALSSVHGPWRGLCHEPIYQRYRRFIADRAMRSNLVIVSTPSLAFSNGVVEA